MTSFKDKWSKGEDLGKEEQKDFHSSARTYQKGAQLIGGPEQWVRDQALWDGSVTDQRCPLWTAKGESVPCVFAVLGPPK